MKLSYKNKKGFSLVEVFLVASLLSIVLGSIFAAYTAGIRVWRNIRETNRIEDAKLFIGAEKMRKELYGYIRNCRDEDMEFEGDEKSLSFPTVSGVDIVYVTYTYSPGKDALMREEVVDTESLKAKKRKKKTKMFEAEKLEFSYLYPDDDENMGGWTESFSEIDDGPPRAIKIDVKRNKEKKTKIIFMP
ncbi:MAG: prepilin-type N-terminal cleavage/methylation domain-containing protein [Candidatus Aadella gelida]|nr:prepilin-type N-terminal cleavage/methylation domain-containing protein [Candidatus Aadella gelida]